MRRLPLLAALALAAPVVAQPSADFARTAAPFIDEHTLVVARVDVTRVDVESVLKLAALVQRGNFTPTAKLGWTSPLPTTMTW